GVALHAPVGAGVRRVGQRAELADARPDWLVVDERLRRLALRELVALDEVGERDRGRLAGHKAKIRRGGEGHVARPLGDDRPLRVRRRAHLISLSFIVDIPFPPPAMTAIRSSSRKAATLNFWKSSRSSRAEIDESIQW